ncbi:PREDICTED: adenine phosphoribosyltransferase [Ceratosolen solmsi marchali]|uniref:Adenine phosphoribosyltransferase n=1 Tax=Ceratosolen solmsi marchali TaxID=326594 RepID=A0AAJ6YSG1_9HYME|nr:PREDICTED: adenine phosphoribosyltransferase [Ceratosolen solmsi marchali]
MEKAYKLKLVKEAIKSYPDFPKTGVLFRDVFEIFQNAQALQALKDLLVEHVALLDIDIIVGLDSKGFLLGPIISLGLAKPFIPIRKKGKLPGKVFRQNYTLEYGEDTFEIQTDAVQGKKKALIVDDLIATGGTMSAAEKLLKELGVVTVECLVIIELTSFKGRSKLEAPLHSLLQFN